VNAQEVSPEGPQRPKWMERGMLSREPVTKEEEEEGKAGVVFRAQEARGNTHTSRSTTCFLASSLCDLEKMVCEIWAFLV